MIRRDFFKKTAFGLLGISSIPLITKISEKLTISINSKNIMKNLETEFKQIALKNSCELDRYFASQTKCFIKG